MSGDPGDPHPWDVGCKQNWTQVMGDTVWDWFLPIRPTQGDGIRFEYNEKMVAKLRARAKEVMRAQATKSVAASIVGVVPVKIEDSKESTINPEAVYNTFTPSTSYS